MIEDKKQIIREMGKLEMELIDIQYMCVRSIKNNLNKCPYCLNKLDIEKITKRIKEIKEKLKTLGQKLGRG